MSKYCLRQKDGDWFMIPVASSRLFSFLAEKSHTEKDYSAFCKEFLQYYIRNLESITFENPWEVC